MRYIKMGSSVFALLCLTGCTLTTLQVPPAPTSVSATAGDGQVTVTWNPVSGANAYILYYAADSLVDKNGTKVPKVISPHVITGLNNGTEYAFIVTAVNNEGESDPSVIVTATPQVQTPPAGMKRISGGTFQMGSTTGFPDEQPVHQVTVSSFFMDSTEVTQVDYDSLMGTNPAKFVGNSRPVEWVTWYDAVLYCNARSKRDGKDTIYLYSSILGGTSTGCTGLLDLVTDYSKNGYRLPTEAEWEYACRGGTTTGYYWGDSGSVDTISNHAWFYSNSGDSTRSVAGKPPNSFGLYDMAGNVREWCNDWYGGYGDSAQTDPTGPTSGFSRVNRGGSWLSYSVYLESANRNASLPDTRNYETGFRCVYPIR